MSSQVDAHHDAPRCPSCDHRVQACRIWIRECAEETCGKLFTARNPKHLTCSPECSRKRRSKALSASAYKRWALHRRRSAERLSDITPAQQEALRKRARKCPLCRRLMTDKPFLPHSKELDHIVPIGMGGTHTHGNVRFICRDCNLRRPKDGSDYAGQLTLWATAPGVSTRPAKPRPQPSLSATCACGNKIRVRTSSHCRECIVKLAQDAARLRQEGWKWQDICNELGYPNTGSLYSLARKYGTLGERAA